VSRITWKIRLVTPSAAALAATLAACSSPALLTEPVSEDDHELSSGPAAFGAGQGWSVVENPRFVRDIDHDGRADIVGFKDGLWVARGQASGGFGEPVHYLAGQYTGAAWPGASTVRQLADVNGDQRLDVVGLNNAGALVALQKADGSFDAPAPWVNDFNKYASLDSPASVRLLGDLDADGKADLVAINDFGSYGGLSNGARFDLQLWTYEWKGGPGGWDERQDVRMLADLNDDGRADLVGLGRDNFFWALSQGHGLASAHSTPAAGWSSGWDRSRHVRVLANVNGDRFPDVVMMGPGGASVGLGTGSGLASPVAWLADFDEAHGWDATRHLRFVADVDRDGKDDLIGIKDDGVYVALSTGTTFLPASKRLDGFGYGPGQDWRVERHPRFVADIDGDGGLEVVGFFEDGVKWAHLSTARPDMSPSWDQPVCSDVGLGGTPGFCAGPWTYDQMDRCTGTDPACGTICTGYGSCERWENGFGTPTYAREATSLFGDWRYCSRTCANNHCSTSCSPEHPLPAGACQGKATERKYDLARDARNAIDAEIGWDSLGERYAREQQAFDHVDVQPVVTTARVPDSDDAASFGTTTHWSERQECQLDLTVAHPLVGTNPACGCTSSVTATCTRDCGAHPHETGLGMPVPVDEYISDQTCSSCDDLPFGTAAEVDAKAACLLDHYANVDLDSVDDAVFRRAVAARLELLYERRADKLTDPRKTAIRGFYEGEPAATTSCQVGIVIPDATCRASGDQKHLTAPAQICANLSRAGVPIAVVNSEVDTCIALLTQIDQNLSGACHDRYHTLVAGDVRAMLDRLATESLTTTGTAAASAAGGVVYEGDDLVFLRKLDGWYKRAVALRDTYPDWLSSTTSGFLRDMWQKAHLAVLELPQGFTPNQETQAGALLTDLASKGYQIDWRILRHAFDGSRPIDSAPLLLITSDALEASVRRLVRLVPIHDAACRLNSCKVGSTPARATELAELNALVAALHDKPALTAVLEHVPRLRARHPDLVAALEAVRDHHDALEAAYAQVSGGPVLADVLSVDDVLPEAKSLAAQVRAASERGIHYAATGFFVDGARRLLTAAILHRSALKSVVDDASNAVGQARELYLQARINMVNDLLAELRGEGELESIADKAAVERQKLIADAAQLDGLLAREKAERAGLVDYMKSFEQLIANGIIDPSAAFSATVVPPFFLRASDAKFPLGGSRNTYTPDRLHAAVFSLQTGQTLRLRVQGQWGPGCALDKEDLGTPDGRMVRVLPGYPTTGPEGYRVDWSSAGYAAKSSSSQDVNSHIHESDASYCTELALGVLPVKLGDCLKAVDSSGHTSSEGTSDGHETRVTASFSSGLRSRVTPFPQAPIGSLLAVITPHSRPYHIVDVQVVGRDYVVAVPRSADLGDEAADVHLVVNDVRNSFGDLCTTVSEDALVVDGSIVTPAASVSRAIGKAMEATIGAMEAQAPAIIAQGALLGAEDTALRSAAWARLQDFLSPTGVGTGALQVEVRQLFQAWVDREIASLARRAQYAQLKLDVDQLALELEGLAREQAYLASQSRFVQLMPRWRLRDLEAENMDEALQALSEVLVWHVAPMFELRNPAQMSVLRGQLSARIDQVLDTDFADDLENIVARFRAVATGVSSILNTSQIELDPSERRRYVIAFPRPGTEPRTDFRKANADAIQTAWSGADSPGHIARFQVSPGDLYGGTGPAHPFCGDQAPVIRRMALAIVTTNGTKVQLYDYQAQGSAGRDGRFTFPTRNGDVTFAPPVDTGASVTVREISDTTETSLLNTFLASPDGEFGSGAGLSPFSTFELDLSDLYAIMTNGSNDFMQRAKAFYLVFDVEPHSVANEQIVLPGVCNLPPAPSPTAPASNTNPDGCTVNDVGVTTCSN
jgi:hypothetical protein